MTVVPVTGVGWYVMEVLIPPAIWFGFWLGGTGIIDACHPEPPSQEKPHDRVGPTYALDWASVGPGTIETFTPTPHKLPITMPTPAPGMPPKKPPIAAPRIWPGKLDVTETLTICEGHLPRCMGWLRRRCLLSQG
jgi:hypothetical protein